MVHTDAQLGEVSAKEIAGKAGCTGSSALCLAFLWDSILQRAAQRELPMHSSAMLSFATPWALLRGVDKYCSRNESEVMSSVPVS